MVATMKTLYNFIHMKKQIGLISFQDIVLPDQNRNYVSKPGITRVSLPSPDAQSVPSTLVSVNESNVRLGVMSGGIITADSL